MSDSRGKLLSPVVLILGASIVSGATGYLVTWIVAARLGPGDYAAFALFWSALYLVVGTFGGVQQEVTRASSSGGSPDARSRSARISIFALALASILFVTLAATSLLWVPALFPDGSTGLVWPLAVGAASYVLVASLCGALYGARSWYPLVALIAVDGLLRLLGVLVALAVRPQLDAIAWAVAAPFPLAVAIVLPLIARRVSSRLRMDVGYGRLSRNVAHTVVASAATAALVSGFPVMLGVTSPDVPAAVIGPLILALTLTRAPIVIPLMALQSYLIVHLGDHLDTILRRALRLIALVAVASLAFAALAAWAGPDLLRLLFGDDFVVGAGMLFVLVASSGLVAALCVSGPAVLARSAHLSYTAGWVVSALVTLALLLLPLDIEARTAIALIGGPAAGLVVHIAGLTTAPRRLATERL